MSGPGADIEVFQKTDQLRKVVRPQFIRINGQDIYTMFPEPDDRAPMLEVAPVRAGRGLTVTIHRIVCRSLAFRQYVRPATPKPPGPDNLSAGARLAMDVGVRLANQTAERLMGAFARPAITVTDEEVAAAAKEAAVRVYGGAIYQRDAEAFVRIAIDSLNRSRS